jgi:hypothetical protein
MEAESTKLLREINETLQKINTREETAELFEDSNKLLEKSDARVEHQLNQIQSAFDRIHDKVFNFNNILIGAYLVLSTFPNDMPKMTLWTVVFPIANLVFLIWIDYRQMEIHREASREQDWTNTERDNYGKMIVKQTQLSMFALLLSLGCLIYLIVKVF